MDKPAPTPLPSAASKLIEAALQREGEHFQELYKHAMAHLARREHARAELENKLKDKLKNKLKDKPEHHTDPDTLKTLLDLLEEAKFLDETRFATTFVAERARRHYGPDRIRAELENRGIDTANADKAINEADLDWIELARRAAARKFGADDIDTLSEDERRRRARYILGRGFAPSTAASALNAELDETFEEE